MALGSAQEARAPLVYIDHLLLLWEPFAPEIQSVNDKSSRFWHLVFSVFEILISFALSIEDEHSHVLSKSRSFKLSAVML